jgi:hypothetical protein
LEEGLQILFISAGSDHSDDLVEVVRFPTLRSVKIRKVAIIQVPAWAAVLQTQRQRRISGGTRGNTDGVEFLDASSNDRELH